MSVKITYFVHGTTTDNENGIATGWNPGKLSELGKRQSIELKGMIKGEKFDAIFCSDLKRAVDSANLTFGKFAKDRRLRECNYGDLNGAAAGKVEKMCGKCIEKPFPNGESYKDVEKRVRSFLDGIKKKYSGRHIAIVAHRGTQLALDVILKGKTWQQAMKEDWRLKKEWKPGWDYTF
ncbi:MAG: histidine phosphatase family protein [Candidatus Aenigmarchaeota archaeon]|nr:histidine phosphatase family protein [Candidatus Aenigmarchaeota archaeon]